MTPAELVEKVAAAMYVENGPGAAFSWANSASQEYLLRLARAAVNVVLEAAAGVAGCHPVCAKLSGSKQGWVHDSACPAARIRALGDGRETQQTREGEPTAAAPMGGIVAASQAGLSAPPTETPGAPTPSGREAAIKERVLDGKWYDEPRREAAKKPHRIHDAGDSSVVTGWRRWDCDCGAAGAEKTLPTRCPYEPATPPAPVPATPPVETAQAVPMHFSADGKPRHPRSECGPACFNTSPRRP